MDVIGADSGWLVISSARLMHFDLGSTGPQYGKYLPDSCSRARWKGGVRVKVQLTGPIPLHFFL